MHISVANRIYLISFNTLRPRRNEQHFADDIFKCIFFNENVWISLKISLKFVPKGPVINIPVLVQKMAWRRSGDKPLSEPMMVSLPTQICVTRPQWVNKTCYDYCPDVNLVILGEGITLTVLCKCSLTGVVLIDSVPVKSHWHMTVNKSS